MSLIRNAFRRLHYPVDIIAQCVRWYLAYSLSLRYLEEIMAERGIALGLLDSDGSPLYFGRKTIGQKIKKGDNTLLLSAYIAKTGPINSGSFSRLLHYTLYYD